MASRCNLEKLASAILHSSSIIDIIIILAVISALRLRPPQILMESLPPPIDGGFILLL